MDDIWGKITLVHGTASKFITIMDLSTGRKSSIPHDWIAEVFETYDDAKSSKDAMAILRAKRQSKTASFHEMYGQYDSGPVRGSGVPRSSGEAPLSAYAEELRKQYEAPKEFQRKQTQAENERLWDSIPDSNDTGW